MTAKELAAMLSGREYGQEITKGEEKLAEEAGLVVVYGYSDDNVELRGAIDAEVGAWNGITLYVNKDGLVDDPACADAENCYCLYYTAVRDTAKKIEAIWGKGGAAWTFETDIPHETFTVFNNEKLFCVGIVFSMEDVKLSKAP